MLSDALMSALFERQVDVGLGLGASELTGAGYRRQSPRWVRRGAVADATARFGPFTDSVSFDTVLLFRNGEVFHRLPLAGVVALPAGIGHTQEVRLGAS